VRGVYGQKKRKKANGKKGGGKLNKDPKKNIADYQLGQMYVKKKKKTLEAAKRSKEEKYGRTNRTGGLDVEQF